MSRLKFTVRVVFLAGPALLILNGFRMWWILYHQPKFLDNVHDFMGVIDSISAVFPGMAILLGLIFLGIWAFIFLGMWAFDKP